MSVRVRYAPSPTGMQHIGGIRTALFNYFFARANGGKFILRIEDTDRERYQEEALQDLYDTLKWLGTEWDEGPDKGGDYGPYVQSQRTELYREYARQLVESGHAYYCFCTSDRLDKLRKDQKENKKEASGYDRKCRNLSRSEIDDYEREGIKPVIRLKVPLEGETVFQDHILGRIKKKNKDVSPDPVLLKSDGFPTYHLANVIDDHFMEITHIMRAQEWLPSGPIHIILYKAFGWEPPVYCHLPMVMGKDGQKLSKRHGSTAVRDFIAKGYLPEAVTNYISLIGWAYDDSREFFTREELEELFTIDKLNKAPGVFDYKKLDWFNGQYIRRKSDEELKELVLPYLEKAGFVSSPVTIIENELLDSLMPLVKERLKVLSDITEVAGFLFRDITHYNAADVIPKKMDAARTAEVLTLMRERIAKVIDLPEEDADNRFKEFAEELGIKFGDLMMPFRVAVTGTRMSPPLIASVKLLGLEKTYTRVDRVIELLKNEV